MATVPFKAFSLEDDAFVQGGLLQDVDVEIVEAQWVPWDYGKQGLVSEDILAVKLTLVQLAEDRKPILGSDGQPLPPVEQFWSGGGNYADVVISDDGYMVGEGPNKRALTKGSNFHFFLQSLRKHGMPGGYLEDGNIGRLKGIKFHLIRADAPKREGLPGNQRAEGGDKKIPVAGSIISGPWGGPVAATKGRAAAGAKVNGAATNGAAAAAPPAAAPVADAEVEAQAEALIRSVLQGEPDNTVGKLQDLKVKVFRKATGDKTIPSDRRNVIGKLAENGPWLEEHAIAVVSSSGAVTLI